MNGIFAVNKPAGPTSQDVVGKLKHIFTKSKQYASEAKPPPVRKRGRNNKFIKIGHGGTLDPLADGVLVIGIGTGTKQLANYLGACEKVYRAQALLGCSTTTYDSEGPVVAYGETNPQKITQEQLDSVLAKFRGKIQQIPPVYSALKMDGKKLYEYARENTPLPRPIEARECEVKQLSAKLMAENADLPTEYAAPQEREFILNVQNQPITETTKQEFTTGAVLELTFSVSSGTYIRSLIHDIGIALGTNAYMTKLTRERQGAWELQKNVLELELFDTENWWPELETTLREGPERMVEINTNK